MHPKDHSKCLSHVLAMMVIAVLRGTVYPAVLNVQNLGHGADPRDGADPQPPAYQGAGVIGTDRDYWNGIRAESFGQPLAPPPSLDSRCRAMVDLGSVADHRGKFITDPLVSFVYEGKHSAELLAQWKSHRASRKLDAQRTEHRLTWTDPKTGLEVRVVGIEYGDYPAVEWTAYFQNTGASNTPILENIQALDIVFERADGDEFNLHGIKGDFCTADSYEPYHLRLVGGE